MAVASPKERFDAAVRVIQSLPKNGTFQPSHAMMLTFYGLFKQASNGPCTIGRPYVWDVVGRAKWDAWNRLGNMPREQAMIQYVEELKKIIETMPHTENVQEFIETLGSFYELIDDGSVSGPMASVIRKNFSPKRSSSPRDEQKTVDDDVTNGRASADVSLSDSSESSPDHSSTVQNGDHRDAVLDEVITREPADGEHVPHLSTVTNGYHSAVTLKTDVADSFREDSDNLTEDTSAESSSTAVNEEVGLIDNPLLSVPVKENESGMTNGTIGRLAADSDALSSDGEEFCDTSDVTGVTVECTRVNRAAVEQHSEDDDQSNDLGSDAVLIRGGGEVTQSEGRTSFPSAGGGVFQGHAGSFNFVHPSALRPDQTLGIGGSGGAEGGGGPVYGMPLYVGSVGTVEQIAVALVRLQQDMNNVLTRLQTLESLTLAQQQTAAARLRSNSNASRDRDQRRRPVTSWWLPFRNFRMSTVMFLVAWPFVVHLVLRLIASRRRRLNRH